MTTMTMAVSLVFETWRGKGGEALSSEADLVLSSGDLHSGSTFPATITVDADTADELRSALEKGLQPTFWMSEASGNVLGARFSVLENEIECLRKVVIVLSSHTPAASAISAIEEKR